MRLACWLALALMFPSAAAACGNERWQIKTLADPRAQDISEAPINTTIFSLGSLPKYRGLPADYRLPEELHTYTVTGYLIGWKLETDEDFHIVLADLTQKMTMIVEMPAAHCMPAAHQALADSVRTSWVARFGKPSKKFRDLHTHHIQLEVTGVGFFDFLHGQTGAAPNGVELHPVVAWQEITKRVPPDGEDGDEPEYPQIMKKATVDALRLDH